VNANQSRREELLAALQHALNAKNPTEWPIFHAGEGRPFQFGRNDADWLRAKSAWAGAGSKPPYQPYTREIWPGGTLQRVG
jgi:hypothetical protein